MTGWARASQFDLIYWQEMFKPILPIMTDKSSSFIISSLAMQKTKTIMNTACKNTARAYVWAPQRLQKCNKGMYLRNLQSKYLISSSPITLPLQSLLQYMVIILEHQWKTSKHTVRQIKSCLWHVYFYQPRYFYCRSIFIFMLKKKIDMNHSNEQDKWA